MKKLFAFLVALGLILGGGFTNVVYADGDDGDDYTDITVVLPLPN